MAADGERRADEEAVAVIECEAWQQLPLAVFERFFARGAYRDPARDVASFKTGRGRLRARMWV